MAVAVAVGFVEVAVSEATEAPSLDSTEQRFADVAGAGAVSVETATAAVVRNDFVATTVALLAFGISSAAMHLVGIASVALGISALESMAVRCVTEKAAPEITMLQETSFY